MMKFFRKHTKHLLAFFMALLLIVWLLGDIIRDWGRGAGQADVEWGKVYGKTVSYKEMVAVRRDTEILEGLGLDWSRLGGLVRYREPLQLREWYMLDAEARRRGIYVPQDLIDKERELCPAETLQRVRVHHKASTAEIDRALQSFMRVNMTLMSDMRAVKVSEAGIQDYVRDMNEKAKVKLAVLDAKQFEDSQYQPTDRELEQQFEKYKDQDPGSGEDRIGYRLPEQVQIEYIKLNVDELAKRQEVNDEEAYDYWKKNMMPTATQPGGQPTTSPAKPYLTFTEGREEVRKKLRMEKAKHEAMRIATDAIKALSEPWVNAPATQPDNYRQPPAVAIFPDPYPKLVEAFRQKAGDAIEFQWKDFLDRQGLDALGAVGRAMALQGTRDQIGLSEAAFLVQGLEASPKEPRYQREARWFRNLYETVAEPFVDQGGNVYVLRTIAIKPKQAAESWRMVKDDQVRKDLKLKHAAAVAEQRANQLAERAKEAGLEEAVKEDPTLVAKLAPPPASRPGEPTPPAPPAVKTPAPFARKQEQPSYYGGGGGVMPTRVAEAGYDPKFAEAVFSLADKAATQPSTAKVTVVAPTGQNRWIVVQLLDILPVTQQEYGDGREKARGALMRECVPVVAATWLAPQNIRARVDYVPAHPEEEKAAEKAERARRAGM